MSKRDRLTDDAVTAFLAGAPDWGRSPSGGAIARSFTFERYADGVAFVVRLGFVAEKRDHHPDITLGYCKATVSWSTHDAGGVTALDLELAQATDELASGLAVSAPRRDGSMRPPA